MKCPFCGHQDDKVIDSRTIRGGEAIRRRRECLVCARRFTSYEEIEEIERMVIKKNGDRVPFIRDKLITGLKKACEKRPVSIDRIREVADQIETELFSGTAEVQSRDIGEMVVTLLQDVDEVAYVRFASVYRQFKDVNDFKNVLKNMLDRAKSEKKHGQSQSGNDTNEPDEPEPPSVA